ncbi:MAG TPA: hypothetical protein VD978_08475 [Azospirillum sp.]|nr:hypothetical protein [Azospirillum sp.]
MPNKHNDARRHHIPKISGPCALPEHTSPSSQAALPFANPMSFNIRVHQALPSQTASGPSGKALPVRAVALEITAVALSPQPPSPADSLPPDLAAVLPQPPQARTLPREYITFNARFGDAQYGDPVGTELVGVGPAKRKSLDDVVKRFETKREELAAAAATPEGPYGADLVGVRLGMSFEEAERAIRSHMKVGRALEGRRAFDAAARSGAIKPLESGKLFLSEAEDELIAIIDEPPAVSGRVLAAWRRVSLPAASAAPGEIFAGIEKKYGKPGGLQELREGTIRSWPGPQGGACSSLYDSGTSHQLSDLWFVGGRPMERLPAISTQAKSAPMPRARQGTIYSERRLGTAILP